MMTQGWKMPQPPHLVALNVDARDAAKNYLPGRRAGGRRRRRLGARRAAPRARRARTPSADAWPSWEAGSARSSRRRTPRPPPSSPPWRPRCPTTRSWSADMCIPGYWLGGFHRTPAPRKLSYPLGWGTLGCAFPQGLGSALAECGAGGQHLRRRRLPVRVRRPGHRQAGADSAHRRGRRRRRLRDAPLRSGTARRPARRCGPRHTGLRPLARVLRDRGDSVDGLGGFAVALKGHVALHEPTLLVAGARSAAAERLAALVSPMNERQRGASPVSRRLTRAPQRIGATSGSDLLEQAAEVSRVGLRARRQAHPQPPGRSCTPRWPRPAPGSSPPSWSATTSPSPRSPRSSPSDSPWASASPRRGAGDRRGGRHRDRRPAGRGDRHGHLADRRSDGARHAGARSSAAGRSWPPRRAPRPCSSPRSSPRRAARPSTASSTLWWAAHAPRGRPAHTVDPSKG